MSVQALYDVWEHSREKGTELLVLLAIADNVNDQSCASENLEVWAKKARVTIPDLKLILAALVQKKSLSILPHERGAGITVYRLHFHC